MSSGISKKVLVGFISTLLVAFALTSVAVAQDKALGANFASDSDIEKQTEQIYNNMDQSERICQTFMVHFKKWGGKTEEDSSWVTELNAEQKEILSKYHFGSFMLFGENIPTVESTLKFCKDIQAASMTPLAGGEQNGLPVLFEIDQEGGTVFRIEESTGMLGNMATGATFDPQCATDSARIIAEEFKALGINYDDCPCIDVNSNAGNPIINIRSFGDDPNQVAKMGHAFLKSLHNNGIIGCIKHFPGHGDVDVDSHKALPSSDKTWDDLLKLEIVPYQMCIPEARMAMTAHVQFKNIDDASLTPDKLDASEQKQAPIVTPATLSHKIITEKLKGELGFKGISVTDALDMKGISDYFTEPTSCRLAIAAGNDMICEPITAFNKADYEKQINDVITELANWGAQSPENAARLEDATKNVIRTKIEKGIINYNPNDYTIEKAHASLRSPEHLTTEYLDAAKSITVVKNNNNTLPIKLDSTSKVLFLSINPNTRHENAVTAIGWNRLKAVGLVPEGATADFVTFDADASSGPYNLSPSFDVINAAIDKADIVVVDSVMDGNYNNGYLGWRTDAPNKMVQYAHAKGKKTVVTSKRIPYDCQLYPDADAVLLSYNHVGTSDRLDLQTVLDKNITVADEVTGPGAMLAVEAIFGNINTCGRLPVKIPRYNAATQTYDYNDLVYDRGFGIFNDQVLSAQNTKIDLDYSGVDKSRPVSQDNCPKAVVTTGDANVTYSSGGVSNHVPVSFTVPIARVQKTFVEGQDYTTSFTFDDQNNEAKLTIAACQNGCLTGSKTVTFSTKLDPAPGGDSSDTAAQTSDMLPWALLCLLLLAAFSTYVICRRKYSA